MTDPEKQFEDFRTALCRECIRLVSAIALFKHLHERKADRLDEMNIAPAFFGRILEALLTEIIIWTYKLLDRREKLSFPKYLAFVEKNMDLFSIKGGAGEVGEAGGGGGQEARCQATREILKKDRLRIKELDSVAASIKLRRNRIYAHFDKRYLREPVKLFEETEIRWSDLDKIVEVMQDIFDTYSAAYDGNTFELKPVNIDDVDSVLDILHEHNESLKRQLF